MNLITITDQMMGAVVKELQQSPLFSDLQQVTLQELTRGAKMCQFDNGEVILKKDTPSDSFYVVVEGEAVIKVDDGKGELIEIARVKPFDTIGELGLLLDQPRSATVEAGAGAILLQFDKPFFTAMFRKLPDFALVTCKVLAKRIQTSSRQTLAPKTDIPAVPEATALNLIPVEFIQRHRVLPLKVDGNILHIGCAEDPTPQMMTSLRGLLPGMELRPCLISSKDFDNALRSLSGAPKLAEKPAVAGKEHLSATRSLSPKLDQLLRRMVAERASDVHLTSNLKPHWRIDGSMLEISDAPVLSGQDIHNLVDPITPERNRIQFKEENDTDFAYAIPGVSRFRVNMFCDNRGPGLVFRQIPDKILTMEQLGLPASVRALCDFPKGLILVTGPTGSGKSTTLAAMIDHINKQREDHIITLEDPVEFVHQTQKCLVNQREVGPHTRSFSRALRAALREDPDIVLVGEMRDLETVQLALEVANTGQHGSKHNLTHHRHVPFRPAESGPHSACRHAERCCCADAMQENRRRPCGGN
jgi:hypothetical protein